MHLDDLRPLELFDGLADKELLALIELGADVQFAPGEELFREGAPAEFWWVLVEGKVDLVRHVGREETVLGAMDVPGRWAGGFRAWDDNGVYLATGRAAVAGRVLKVPAQSLRDWSSAWFPFGAHLIEGLFRTARNFEAMTRQREALVALGTLAAGLAHEINNPAAAATRAVDALGNAWEVLLSALGRLAEGSISADQFLALDTLRREIEPPPISTDPMANADREDNVSTWLARHDIEKDWLIAAPLARAGVDVAWCERAAAVLDGAALEPGLEWVASTVSAQTLLAEVKESTRRISELVGAVKSYSQLDRASMQETDVAEGLESTLVMLKHKIPAGVTVVREYAPDAPRIETYPGDLNQVWTNLIDNAIDAMEDEGVLRIATRVEGDAMVVDIGDTGPGMPPEVQARAFEPFFTTKEVGKGTGLGLDVCRSIVVDRHHGQITIDSVPGRTVVTVRLPLQQP